MQVPDNFQLPTVYSVVFNTTASGHMSCNNPPCWDYTYFCSGNGLSVDTSAFPPFNNYVTWINGDSGAPNMWPATDGTLVFLYGDTTSPASSQMQNDMNTLCQWQGLDYTQTRYQMQQHALQ